MEGFGGTTFAFRNDSGSLDDCQPLAEGFGLTPKLIYAFCTGDDNGGDKRLYSTELCASMLGLSLGSRTPADNITVGAPWRIPDHTDKEASSSDLSASVSSATASLPSAGSEEDTAEKNQKRRRRRGKNKAPAAAVPDGGVNKALDPVKYKTQLCKNWETEGKCPYGPRCLFAHGVKQLRTVERNGTAISEAERASGDPHRSPNAAFYRIGKFPEFMPMPTNAAAPVPSEAHPSTPVLAPEEDPVFPSVICNRLPGYPVFTW